MNKKLRKNIHFLRKMIGHKIIRYRETTSGDFSFTSDPVILRGLTSDGCMIVSFPEGTFGFLLHKEIDILPKSFSDRNWKLYSRIKLCPEGHCSKWVGKYIHRVKPTSRIGDRSFIQEPVRLIAASKWHFIVEYNLSRWHKVRSILNYDYTNPKHWELVK